MIVKNRLALVVVHDDREYSLSCPYGAPLTEVYTSLDEMKEYVGKILQEQAEKKAEEVEAEKKDD